MLSDIQQHYFIQYFYLLVYIVYLLALNLFLTSVEPISIHFLFVHLSCHAKMYNSNTKKPL